MFCRNPFCPEEPLVPCECSVAGEVPAAATAGCADPAGSCQLGSREQSRTPCVGQRAGTHNKAGGSRVQKGQQWRPKLDVTQGQKPRVKRGQEAAQPGSVGGGCRPQDPDVTYSTCMDEPGIRLCTQSQLKILLILALIGKFFISHA